MVVKDASEERGHLEVGLRVPHLYHVRRSYDRL